MSEPKAPGLVVNPTLAIVGGRDGFRASWCGKTGGVRRASISGPMATALLRVQQGADAAALFDERALGYLTEQGFLVAPVAAPTCAPPGASADPAVDTTSLVLDERWTLVMPPRAPVVTSVRAVGPRFIKQAPWGGAEARAADSRTVAAFAVANTEGPAALTEEECRALAGLGVLASPASIHARRAFLDEHMVRARDAWAADERCVVPLVTEAERLALVDYVERVVERGWLDGDYGPGGKQRAHVFDDPQLGFLLDRGAQWARAITGRPLVGSYSFLALYQAGGGLPVHRDKRHCELSFSLCIDASAAVVERWPLELEDEDGARVALRWAPGEAAFFNGRRYAHRRAPLVEEGPAMYLVLHLMTDPEALR